MAGKDEGIDIFPQPLRFKILESAPNTFTEIEISLTNPIPEGKKTKVMNFLRILLDGDFGTFADGDGCEIAIYDRSRTAMPVLGDPGVICKEKYIYQVATQGASFRETGFHFELSDGAGHGWLYGRRSLYIGIEGVSQVGALNYSGYLLYTYKILDAIEAIGVIQS